MSPCAACLLTVGLFLQATASSNDVEVALADDDYCGANSDAEECSLHALQKRIARVESSDSDAGVEGETQTVTGHPLIHLELYRAIRKHDLSHPFANVDMGSVAGIMNYLHSDVVGEHVGDYAGYEPKIGSKERINGVDTIAGVRAHVKNPDSVIDAVGHHVDFALSAHFIDGEATGPAYNWNFGDIVGVQDGEDERWPFENPYYRFSMSGFCPNLKWSAKKHGAYAALKKFQQEEHSTASGRRRRRDRGLCMMYSEQHNLPYGQVLKGGLCPNGTQPGMMPTGYAGCIYTYEPQSMVNLDELVGITKQSCGNRKCRDWRDWRRHCSDSKYKRKFNYQYRRRYNKLRRTKTCVEYDIHKACAKSCSSAACQKIPPNRREVGLPFWKGRCSSLKNAQRVEALAMALGIHTAGTKHQLLQAPTGETCLSATSTLCKPNATSGGPYCTRLWGGVCQPCHVPGAKAPAAAASTSHATPACPWDIFIHSGDYRSPMALPKCASNLPSDLCCLYTSSCNTTLASPTSATEDGFAYVSSRQDNDAMVALLVKAANETLGLEISDVDRLSKMAYWQWGLAPLAGKTLESSMRMVEHYFKQ